MTEAKHTPGPWKVCSNMSDDLCVGTDEDDPWFIAELCLGAQGCDVPIDPAPANARLIAAAPALLTELSIREGDLVMLRKAIECGDPKHELTFRIDDMLRETRAAISKATGAQ